MVSLDEAVVIRLETHGKNFEVFADPDTALKVRQKKQGFTPEALAVEDVFSDARSGDRPPSEDLETFFGTKDLVKIAESIVKKGKFHLTTEQKKKMIVDKKKMIVAQISKNAVNPQNNLPHPPQRIERIIEEKNIQIDPFIPAPEQLQDVVVQLRDELPISFEKKRIEIRIPAKYAPKLYGKIKNSGQIKKESWENDGSLFAELEFPAGMQDHVYNIINSGTHGECDINVLE